MIPQNSLITNHDQFQDPETRLKCGIALGSNLGDSEQILSEAINELKKIHQGQSSSFLSSSFYKTAPLNCPSTSPDFLNAVVHLETTLTPNRLIQFLQKIEVCSGRPFPHPKNTPRTLDLDLLYCDLITLSTPELELPHPRIRERSFVLIPLVEILPDLILPGWDKSAQEYLRDINKISI